MEYSNITDFIISNITPIVTLLTLFTIVYKSLTWTNKSVRKFGKAIQIRIEKRVKIRNNLAKSLKSDLAKLIIYTSRNLLSILILILTGVSLGMALAMGSFSIPLQCLVIMAILFCGFKLIATILNFTNMLNLIYRCNTQDT